MDTWCSIRYILEVCVSWRSLHRSYFILIRSMWCRFWCATSSLYSSIWQPTRARRFEFLFGKRFEVETSRTIDGNKFVKYLLNWCPVSLIFHSSELCKIMLSRPSRPFSNITIFQYPKLLESVIPFVTTDPTPNMITVSTGIPPNTKIIKYFNDFATNLHDISLKVDNLYVGLKKVVTDVIEDNME